MNEVVYILIAIIMFLFGIFIHDVFYKKELNAYYKAITECEATLPRNQHCKVIGVIIDE